MPINHDPKWGVQKLPPLLIQNCHADHDANTTTAEEPNKTDPTPPRQKKTRRESIGYWWIANTTGCPTTAIHTY